MNTQPEERNPFPEPQTIPAGWDLSTILAAAASASPVEDADSTQPTSS